MFSTICSDYRLFRFESIGFLKFLMPLREMELRLCFGFLMRQFPAGSAVAGPESDFDCLGAVDNTLGMGYIQIGDT